MNKDIVNAHKNIWGNSPDMLLADYAFQPDLTKKLDALVPSELNREKIYEIVLWKLNRFPEIENDLLEKLKTVISIQPRNHRDVQSILRELLVCKGVALPMASTILRFLNPQTFQIIDDRVYRSVYGLKAGYPSKPKTPTERYLNASESIYFDYLDELHKLSCKRLPFSSSDRILYELDIKLGYRIGNDKSK